MTEEQIEQIKQLANESMKLGFNMGVTAMRLKVMETMTPYIDREILQSKLLTAVDVMQLTTDALKEFDAEIEFLKMKELMDGLG